MKKYLVSTALIGFLALASTAASAAVVCNDEGDCWKTKDSFTYPPDASLHVYDDDWKWKGDNIAGAMQVRGAAIGVAAFGSAFKPMMQP